MGAKSKLTVPERRKIVLSLIRREEPAAVLARRYGVSENTLYRWRDEFLAAGEAALANGKNKADARDRQIAELKKDLIERDKVTGSGPSLKLYPSLLRARANTDRPVKSSTRKRRMYWP